MKMQSHAVAGLLLIASFGAAADAPPVPGRAAEYDALQMFVGRWTERGNEKTFVETCDWFDGKYHVVCHAERKRADGTIGRSMSVLSFVPGEGFVHVGLNNRGLYETLQHGTFRDGVMEFRSTTKDGDKSVVTRIRIQPVGKRAFDFVVDTSTDGGPWVPAETVHYVGLER